MQKKKKNNKWMQNASKQMERKGTKGSFTEWCKQHGFSGVTAKAIAYAKKVARETGNTTLMRRAVFAENARKAKKNK